MGARDFVGLIGQAAQGYANVKGVPASVAVAEVALESGWGEQAQTCGYVADVAIPLAIVTFCRGRD